MNDLSVKQLTAQALSNMHLKMANLYSQLMLTKTEKERRQIEHEIYAANDFIKATKLLDL